MTAFRRLDITTLTRFFIGGQGPLRTSVERLMAAPLVGAAVLLAISAALHVLYAAAWVLHWVVEVSTRTVPRADVGKELAILLGQICVASLAAVTIIFVIKRIAERLSPVE